MAHTTKNGPQFRAPLKWGEGAKNPTASRHLGCPTVPYSARLLDKNEESRVGERRKAKFKVNIGSWNVRTMRVKGKLENVKEEMRRLKLNVLGLSEVRWEGVGDFVSDEVRVIYSGSKGGQKGVAVLLDIEAGKRVTKIVQHSDRLLLVRIEADPVDLVLLQVYMPTTAEDDEEIESLYEQIEELVKKEKATDQVIIMGDWNAVVGEGREDGEVGEFGLGVRNERGQMLVDFCKRMKMVVTNTWFKHEKRRRYTWKRPGDTGRFQLDYILVKHRYRNSVKNSRAYPGADANSDHNLVVAKIELKLKKIPRRAKVKRWCLSNLQSKKVQFQTVVEKELAEGSGRHDGKIDSQWTRLKDAIKGGAAKVFGFQSERVAKKPWVSEEMIEKMNERRKWKGSRTEEGRKKYLRLNNELRRETDKAREEWWDDRCDELEEYDRRGRSDLMYQEVSRLTRTGKKVATKNAAINDASGELITATRDIKDRWTEYIEELYSKSNKPRVEDFELEKENQVESDQKGPGLLIDEIHSAIKEIKNGKATGIDDIPAEFLKLLDEKALEKLAELCVEIYETGNWPEDFTKVVMIPIPKKANAVECADYRTISLISHASKILLKILTKRLENKAEMLVSKTQFGFRKGCGTREAIGAMRTLCERSLEHGNDVFICFVDYEKAFDRVDWVKMLDILKEINVDWRDRRLIMNLYMQQKAVVKVLQEYSEESDLGRGVRQGCCMSPLLFNIYAEAMMIEAMEGLEEGIKVGGKLLQDIRFADDQGMVASSESGLQKIMDRLSATAEEYGMKINIKKTKVMKVSKSEEGRVSIVIDGKEIEQVRSFKYLGSTMTEDGRCETEIKIRIALAKDAFSKRKELLTKRFSRKVKKKIIKTLVWTTLLYGCETWTLRKEEIRRLEAVEMWLWRRMEKISYTERITNEEVLRRIGEGRQLLNVIRNRKKNWIGHILRGEGLVREVIEGRMEGKRSRGRPRTGMLDDLIVKSYGDTKRRAENRNEWRSWVPWTCR